ncbi:DNA polymerase [Pseudomonas phage Nerthus]|uniref:DNA polymerase n=1 Tax=Pseudomonas phage Nerthus TaxID=2163984 RepID=A0A2S1GMN8_9CAUD|nr:DNA polymerase [Pseudomonas phage Nerthus]AWD90647.1 DNA polymerase [Pseudomonas phage Nerthus]
MDTLQHYPSMHPKGQRLSGKGRFLIVDSEAEGLLPALRYNDPTCVHEIVLTDAFTQETFVFFDPYEKRNSARVQLDQEGGQDGYLEDALHMMMEAESLVFQNGVGYDVFLLEYVWPKVWKYNYLERRGKDREHQAYFPMKMMDTMLISQLTNPDRKPPQQAFAIGLGNIGAHSIAAHGIRIGRFKPDNEDWSHLTDHMIHRCIEDTIIGRDMFFWLMHGDWAEAVKRGANKATGFGISSALRMESQVALAITRQALRGFRLDMPQAKKDWDKLGQDMEDIATKIRPHIPDRLVTEPMKRKHIDATCAAYTKAFNDDSTWLRQALTPMLVRTEQRIGSRATMWAITTKSGDYSANLKKVFPEMVGNKNDTKDPLVAGPFTPIVYEQIGLGNLEYMKENVLYPRGWRGVNFSEGDEAWMESDENPSGEPPKPWSGKIDETSLKAWAERDGSVPEFLQGLVSWYVLRSRRSQILNVGDVEYFLEHKEWPRQASGKRECRGLMARAFNREQGIEAQDYFAQMGEWPVDPDDEWRVPAAAFSIGTNTFRMRHKYVVNIPSRGLHPLRHLFIAGKGMMVLGCDGSGLELRMLAHFMNDPTYIEVVLHGDIHSHNQQLAGLLKRDTAKTFIYAFLYGSGIKNLARVCGISEAEMEQRVARFRRELPTLAALIDRLEAEGNQFGYLHAIDGRWGRIRRSGKKIKVHTVLNVLLQMTGSLTMKYGLCLAENEMKKEGVALDKLGHPRFIANVHDEVQMEVPEDEVLSIEYELPYQVAEGQDEKKAIKAVFDVEEKRVHIDVEGRMWSAASKVSAKDGIIVCSRKYHRAGAILAETMTKTGELFKLNIPLAGEYKIGKSWHDTH